MTPPAIIFLGQTAVFFGVYQVNAGANHGDGAAGALQRPDMRGGIYALSHSACHAKAGFGKRARKNFGVFCAAREKRCDCRQWR